MGIKGLMAWAGMHAVSESVDSERRCALGRAVHGSCLLVLVAATTPWRDGAFGSLWLAPAVALGYALLGLVNYLGPWRNPGGWRVAQYPALLVDSAVFAVFLCDAPRATAFLAPYAILLPIPVGLCHGLRAFGLSWAAMVATLPPLLYFGHEFWRSQPQLDLALAFMALLQVAFFPLLHGRLDQRLRQDMQDSKQLAVEDAMVAKSGFLARVSHQLRSPLQAIVSSLELMESPTQQAMRHQLVANISASAGKLSRELTDLLTIARAEAWQLHLQPSAFDAGMLLESVAADILDDLEYENRKIYRVVPREPVFLVADSDKIVQVLANVAKHVLAVTHAQSLTLVMNALVPASESVIFMVKAEIPASGAAQGTATVPTAQATGTGAAHKYRDELHDSLSSSLVKTLVEFLGGSLETGSGSPGTMEFSVSFPCEIVPGEEGQAVSRTPGQILLVTPCAATRCEAPRLLGRLGHEVESVCSVPVAANRLALREYALVLVDQALPRRGGKQLALGMKNGDGLNRETSVVSFNARPGAAKPGACWPFDAAIPGALSAARLDALISALSPGKLRR